MRLADARRDQYRRLAKDQGYRARSAYKLLQINRSYHIIKKGDKVVDLGCAPGGWLQVAVKEVRSSGNVIGMDLKPVTPVTGAIILQGSIEDPNMLSKIAEILGCKADVVLSDLAPNVSRRMGYRSCKADFTFHNCITVCAACAKSRRKQCVQGV